MLKVFQNVHGFRGEIQGFYLAAVAHSLAVPAVVVAHLVVLAARMRKMMTYLKRLFVTYYW